MQFFIIIAYIQLSILLLSSPEKDKTTIILGKKSGEKNAIVINTKNSQTLVDEPLTKVKLKKGGKLSKPKKISEDELRSNFGNVINASPLKPFAINLFFKKETDLAENSKKLIPKIIEEIKKREPCKIDLIVYSNNENNIEISDKKVQYIIKLFLKREVNIHSFHILPLKIDKERNKQVEITIK